MVIKLLTFAGNCGGGTNTERILIGLQKKTERGERHSLFNFYLPFPSLLQRRAIFTSTVLSFCRRKIHSFGQRGVFSLIFVFSLCWCQRAVAFLAVAVALCLGRQPGSCLDALWLCHPTWCLLPGLSTAFTSQSRSLWPGQHWNEEHFRAAALAG